MDVPQRQRNLSIITRCLYLVGVHKAGFDCSNEIFSNAYQKQIDKNHP